MGKKKPFIDKKKASTYHLLHRSQRDVAGDHAAAAEGATSTPLQQQCMVLWPADDPPTNQKQQQQPSHNNQAVVAGNSTSSSTLAAWRAKLQAVGLLDVDHERYLKPISGTGTFLDGKTGRAVALDSTSSTTQQQQNSAEDELLEVDRQFDSIPLTAEFMDEDIAAALFGDFDEGDFEELNDDFILDAAAEPEPQEGAAAAFDFDEHIQRLMAQAARERRHQPEGAGTNGSKQQQQHPHEYGQEDQAYFSNLRPLHERDDEDDEQQSFGYGTTVATEPGVVAKLNPDEERALCEKFEATLAEYDDDDSDGCDGFDDDDGHGDMLPQQEEIHSGLRPLEGDAVVEAALDDFLQEKEDDIFIRGTRYLEENKRRGGSGFSVLVGTRMVPAGELDHAEHHPEQEPARPVDELLAQARETLAQPKQKPPPEEVFIDGKSYFSERERNPWDCESILSTYSNLDNNPTTIAANVSSRRRRQRNKKQPPASSSVREEEEEEPVQHIRLSAKTGLPVGVLDSQHKNGDDDDAYHDDTTTFLSINRGERRNKHETAEEKKARKLLVKRERELARLQKKMTKQVFLEEFQRRAVGGDGDVAGQTVFRF